MNQRELTETRLREIIDNCDALLPAKPASPADELKEEIPVRNLRGTRRLAERGLFHLNAGDPEYATHVLAGAERIYGLALTQAMEANWRSGAKTKASASLGHEAVHGDEKTKNKKWETYQRDLELKLQKKPAPSLTEARRRVARDHGVSLKTVTRHTTDPNKK